MTGRGDDFDWKCCGEFMYMARSERDEEGTPVHHRRCDQCGKTVTTEERVLAFNAYFMRAASARDRNRRYASFQARLCKVCGTQYLRRGYTRHVSKQVHLRALEKRRRANHWKQIEAQRRYRVRHSERAA